MQTPLRNLYLKEALHALIIKKAVARVRVRTSLAFFNRFIVPKPNQKWGPILDLSALNKFLSVKTFKIETPETIRISLQQGEWVTSLDFSDAYFHIPVHNRSRKFLRFHFQNQTYQFRGLPFGLSTAPMVKLMAQSRGIRIHQYLDDSLIRAPTRESCHLGTQSLLALCQELGWIVNLQKSELEPKQVFKFVDYQYDLLHRLVKLTQNRWNVNSTESVLYSVQSDLLSQEVHVSDRPSHSNGKTGASGQTSYETHSVAPQQTLEGSRVTGKGDPSPKDSSPTPSVVDQGNKCLTRSTPAPLASCPSGLYRRLKRRLGCSFRRLHSKRLLVSSRKSAAHKFPGIKSYPAGLKKFQHIVQGQIVLVATDNTTVVAYINKEGGMRSGSLCALLWRLLCWCNLRHIVLKARHIPGHLNVIADKLPRQGQIIETEWSLHQEVFDLMCQTWHRPQVDMFATRYSCKLTKFVSPVPDPNAWAVDTVTVSWEDLDMYAFPPVSLLGKVVSKLSDHLYMMVILIAPGWPNMPWFWDLVDLSFQIPLCLPNHPDLVTQPFNKAHHRDLISLNLQAWLLEPRQSRNRGSLAQWRYELRLLKDVQPDQSMRQSGPFLLDGVKQVRWTSGRHLSNK